MRLNRITKLFLREDKDPNCTYKLVLGNSHLGIHLFNKGEVSDLNYKTAGKYSDEEINAFNYNDIGKSFEYDHGWLRNRIGYKISLI